MSWRVVCYLLHRATYSLGLQEQTRATVQWKQISDSDPTEIEIHINSAVQEQQRGRGVPGEDLLKEEALTVAVQ